MDDVSEGRGCTPRVQALATAFAAVVISLALLVAACGGGPTGLLEGTVTLGPIAPVEQPGGGPNSRPYAAVIDIQTLDGEHVTTVESGADGRFSVRLTAGGYRLVPRPREEQPLPYATPLDVTVTENRTTSVTISYDSGIRLPD